MTLKNNGGDVSATSLMYMIYPVDARPGSPVFSSFAPGFTSGAPFTDASGQTYSTGGDQKWSDSGSAISLLTASGFSGVGSQQYTLERFFKATTNLGDRFLDNGGANYFASWSFTAVVPTPSTYVAGALLLGLVAWQVRRRKMVPFVA